MASSTMLIAIVAILTVCAALYGFALITDKTHHKTHDKTPKP